MIYHAAAAGVVLERTPYARYSGEQENYAHAEEDAKSDNACVTSSLEQVVGVGSVSGVESRSSHGLNEKESLD